MELSDVTDWWEDYDPAVDDRRAPDDCEDSADDSFDDAVDEGHDSDRPDGSCVCGCHSAASPVFRPVEWGE